MTSIRRQRGVLIFLTPFLMVALAVVAVLAMDAARLYSLRADMQRVVNAAATAAADATQACSVDADISQMKARALAAANAVGFDGDAEDLEVLAGVLVPESQESAELAFEQREDIRQTNAVAVRYTRNEPISKLLPETFFAPVELSVNAASRKEVYAVLSAGASSVQVSEGLLGGLLGAVLGQPDAYNLDATDVDSLQGTLVGVGDLLDEMGVADLTELAERPLIEALNGILGLSGVATEPAADVVTALKDVIGIEGLTVEDALDIKGDKDGAMGARFPLYDFVISVVMNSASSLSDSGLLSVRLDTFEDESSLLASVKTITSILADIDLSVDLHVDNPAPVVIGPAMQDEQGWVTTLRASDIKLEALAELGLKLDALETLLEVLSLGTSDVELADHVRVPLVVDVGGGSAEFVGARCARPSTDDFGANDIDLEVELDRSVLSVTSGTLNPATGDVINEPISASILEIDSLFASPVGVCLSADLWADVPAASGLQTRYAESYPLHCPDGECATSVFEGDDSTGLGGLDLGLENFRLLGCDGESSSSLDEAIEILLSPITLLLEEVTRMLLEGLIAPVLELLGVDLAGMSITVVGADQLGHQLIENVEID